MNIDTSYKFGIVQGRLTRSTNNQLQCFPKNWDKEFEYSKKLKISFIELLSERQHNPNNPLWSKRGREKLLKLADMNELYFYTACSDYILDNNLFNSNSTVEYLLDFIKYTADLNCKKIILPLMDCNLINQTNLNDYSILISELQKEASKFKINILIESLLNYPLLLKLLDKIGPPIKCVFDTGNIINQIDCIYSEIIHLKDFIDHVHIKDKYKNNNSCLLGEGIVDFEKVFYALQKIQYDNSLVFETPRGHDPIKTCRKNIEFIENLNPKTKYGK